MEIKRVKFFSSYCSQEQITKNIISSWGGGSNVYKNIHIVSDDSYEYAILLNNGRPDKEICKENVIGFSHEPRMTLGLNDERIEYISKKVSEYYLSNNIGLPQNFISGFTFVCPSEFGESKNEIYDHENRMSMILSMSNFMPGHNMRHMLLKKILETDLNIHFYAEGLNKIYSDPRVKEFGWDIFSKPYEEYEFQIVIENVIDTSWSTEKLTNCIIKETIPLYYGSKKISEIFYPKDSIILLDDNLESNFEKIRDLYLYGKYDRNLAKRAKKILYDEVNLMEYLYRKLNDK
jgi:hypothetical protein